ncbi:MAG: PAS domain-containing protein [bacterium]
MSSDARAPAPTGLVTDPASILQSITDGCIVLDADWRFTYVNRRAADIFRPLAPDRDALIGDVIWTVFPELADTPVYAAYHAAVRTGDPQTLEVYYPPTAGWYHVRAYPSPAGLTVLFEDITRRKHAEATVAAEKRLLGFLVTDAPLAEVLTAITREVEARSGPGARCHVRLHDESGQPPGEPAPDRRLTALPIRASRGEVLGTLVLDAPRPAIPGPGDDRLVEVARDIAAIAIERARTGDAMARGEALTRGIVEGSTDCIKTLSLDGTLTWISDNGLRALCITDPRDVLGRRYAELWSGDDRRRAESMLQAAARGETAGFEGFFPVGGEPRWWNVLASPMLDPEGKVERLLVISRDVTERVLAAERLRDEEAQLRLVADSIPQLAWMARPDGHIFWYNRRWYEYTGTTFEDMEGWGWQAVHDPAVLPRVVEQWTSALATGGHFEMEFPLRRADGVMRWFLTQVRPLRDAQGRVTRWFGTNTDIDETRHIREALQAETRMLELLNQAGITLAASLELQAILQTVTDSATALSGAQFGAFFYNIVGEDGEAYQLYTLAGAPREAFEKLGHPRATAIFAPTFRGEGIIRSADVTKDPRYGREAPWHGMPPGHLPVCSYLAVPVASRSGEVIGGLFFGHPEPDVFGERTERLVAGIAAQAAVAIDNARLFEAVQRSAIEREALLDSERHARSEAERASRMKDEFLATLSHELRNPLSAILGWAHHLGRARNLDPAVARGVEIIERNARLQAQLIEDLLDMSSITSGKLRLDIQPVDPAEIVRAAFETVRPAADAKEIEVALDLEADAGPIAGDARRLQQVVWNLLTNAVKFTPRRGRVEVRLARIGSLVELRVSDSGVGIDPQFVEHVFERFRQADATTTKLFGGLGLGLSIVKHLVELHGGTVRAESAGTDQGARFVVQLPVSGAPRDAADEAPARARDRRDTRPEFAALDLGGLTVLVVDDQPDACEFVARLLAECGARAATATSARAALDAIREAPPEALVSDIGMPQMDGYELIRAVRALPADKGGRVPAIAMTAFARSTDRERALAAGFDRHLAKPVDPADLIATIASLTGRVPSEDAPD